MVGHAVQDPTCAGDQTITAFFLNAWQTGQEFVGDVFAQAFFAEHRTGNVQAFLTDQGGAVGLEIFQLKAGHFHIMDLAQVVVQARHFQPLCVGRDHAPAGQVVEGSAPQHGFFTASIHGNVAANATGFSRRGVNRKDPASVLCGISHTLRDHAHFGPNGGHFFVETRQLQHLNARQGFEFFSVDDRTVPSERHSAAGVASTTPTRNDGQAQGKATFDQIGHLGLCVGGKHHEGIFDAPVGGVSHVTDTRQGIEFDVVFGGQFAQGFLRFATQCRHGREGLIKAGHRLFGQHQQLAHQAIAQSIGIWRAALLHLAQAVLQSLDQQFAAVGVVEQVILQIGVALNHPNVTQDLVQHAGRTARAALIAKLVQKIPGTGAQQTNHNFSVREACVVVGNFAQTGGRIVRLHQVLEGGWCVHEICARFYCRGSITGFTWGHPSSMTLENLEVGFFMRYIMESPTCHFFFTRL